MAVISVFLDPNLHNVLSIIRLLFRIFHLRQHKLIHRQKPSKLKPSLLVLIESHLKETTENFVTRWLGIFFLDCVEDMVNRVVNVCQLGRVKRRTQQSVNFFQHLTMLYDVVRYSIIAQLLLLNFFLELFLPINQKLSLHVGRHSTVDVCESMPICRSAVQFRHLMLLEKINLVCSLSVPKVDQPQNLTIAETSLLDFREIASKDTRFCPIRAKQHRSFDGFMSLNEIIDLIIQGS
jgi:hypothetical protein